MSVRWSAEPPANLQAITAFIARNSPHAARDEMRRVFPRSQELNQPPLPGRPMHGYPGAGLRMLLERVYRIALSATPTEGRPPFLVVVDVGQPATSPAAGC